MNLKAEQQQLYALLSKENRCFVRICESDDALWISDLPRKMHDLAGLESLLFQNGFVCRLDQEARLWHVDWSESRWNKMLSGFPKTLPAFPESERYHAAYALCRLWLAHPAQLMSHTMPTVRRVLKLMEQPEEKLLKSIASLHEEAALQLRTGRPTAHAAGWILAKWLNERS